MAKPLPVRDERGQRGYDTASSGVPPDAALGRLGRGWTELFRAGRSVIHPSLHGGYEVRAIKRRQRAAIARIPAPADQIVLRNVFHDLGQGAVAVLSGVFELAAELAGSFALNDHFHIGGGERPLRISGRAVGT